MIYSPERKNNNHTMIKGLVSLIINNIQYNELAIFLLCWRLLLHYVPNEFLFVSCHVSPISAGSQLTFSFKLVGPGPASNLPPLQTGSGSSGSRQLPTVLSGKVTALDLRILHEYCIFFTCAFRDENSSRFDIIL